MGAHAIEQRIDGVRDAAELTEDAPDVDPVSDDEVFRIVVNGATDEP